MKHTFVSQAVIVVLALAGLDASMRAVASTPEYCDGKTEDPWQDQVCEQWHDPDPPSCIDNDGFPDGALPAAIWFMKPTGNKLYTCHRVPDGQGECATHTIPCQQHAVKVYPYEMRDAKCYSWGEGLIAPACERGDQGGRCKPVALAFVVATVTTENGACEINVILPNTKFEKQTPLTATEGIN